MNLHRDATLSEDGRYRFRLTRRWGNGQTLPWVMLNPSTADAEVDDPTIRRVIGFSHRWGFDACAVVNLFALRATNPAELRTADDPVGVGNDALLANLFATARAADIKPIAAWGSVTPVAVFAERATLVEAMAEAAGCRLDCLGWTKHGDPRHPLYMRADTTAKSRT